MKLLPNDLKSGVIAVLGFIGLFILWAVFIWFGWNGFLVAQFGLKHMGFSSAAGFTVLNWLLFIFLLGLREL